MKKMESERIEKLLLALLLVSMKGLSLKEKIHMLDVSGFSNVEIANMLDTSAQVVAQYRYDIRKSKSQARR